MNYTELRTGLTITRSAEGTTWTEKRLYESSDLEAVLAALPPKNSAHPTIPYASLLDASVTLAEAKDKSIATLSYGPRTATQQTPRAATNAAGETWEWMMVSQMMHITTVIGLSEWNFVPHVREWNNMIAPPRVGAEGPDISTGIRKSDSGFEGLEVYRPTGALRVNKIFEDIDQIDAAFRQTIYGLQAKVNRAAWVDWGPQEVLFIGANIRKGVDSASIDYNFLFGRKEDSPKFKIMATNASAEAMDEITVSDGIYPFQAVWQESSPKNYRPASGENGQSKKPIQAINLKIADVYDLGDFDLLGLTSPEEPPAWGEGF